MNTGVKVGGAAALVQALCYVCGFVMLATVMNPGSTDGWSQVQRLEFILERAALFQVWNIVIYVVFGIALVVLAVVLHRLLESASALLMAIATPFGLIWAGLVIASGMVASVGLSEVAAIYSRDVSEAASTWSTIGTIQNGLGGGVEIVGGLWVLLISIASLRSGAVLPKPLNSVGLLVGAAGIATIIPALGMLGALFGLAQIVWFIGVGIVLLQGE